MKIFFTVASSNIKWISTAQWRRPDYTGDMCRPRQVMAGSRYLDDAGLRIRFIMKLLQFSNFYIETVMNTMHISLLKTQQMSI